MACAYELDLAAITSPFYSSNTAYRFRSNLLPLSNGSIISYVRVRVATDATGLPTLARSFRYGVIVPIGGSTVQCVYASGTFVHTGAAQIETFALSVPYSVPASGTYYSFFQQGSGTAVPETIGTLSGAGQTYYYSSTSFSNFITVGATATITSAAVPDVFVMVAAEECSGALTLTPAAIAAQAAIAAPTLTVGSVLTSAEINSAPSEIATATLIVGVPLTPSNISGQAGIHTSTLILEGVFTPAEIAGSAELQTATLTRGITLTPAGIIGSASLETTSVNQNILLWPADIEASAYLPSVFNGDLSSLVLSSKSSRTPDAGIELSWEDSGIPRAFSWYNKTIYKFHLDFAQITEDQCLWLEEYFRLHRYDEIDYNWPFDNHIYRCILMSDVRAMYVRNDDSLGTYCTAALDLIGYEIA